MAWNRRIEDANGRDGHGRSFPFFLEAAMSEDYSVASKIELTPDYWDCECEVGYIHPNVDTGCAWCGAVRDEQPDSRVDEVQALSFVCVSARAWEQTRASLREALALGVL
ncbi:MAG: hypothetical protein GY803_08105 [Chloroflexi bacterium]|nr:hypothetical protein [Chloroflexota bacterium]